MSTLTITYLGLLGLAFFSKLYDLFSFGKYIKGIKNAKFKDNLIKIKQYMVRDTIVCCVLMSIAITLLIMADIRKNSTLSIVGVAVLLVYLTIGTSLRKKEGDLYICPKCGQKLRIDRFFGLLTNCVGICDNCHKEL